MQKFPLYSKVRHIYTNPGIGGAVVCVSSIVTWLSIMKWAYGDAFLYPVNQILSTWAKQCNTTPENIRDGLFYQVMYEKPILPTTATNNVRKEEQKTQLAWAPECDLMDENEYWKKMEQQVGK